MQDNLIGLITSNHKGVEKGTKIGAYTLVHKGEYVAANDLPNKEEVFADNEQEEL